jgi:alpha-aminoadipic semialdehyde synthase
MLQKILDSNSTLIDYERISTEDGRRIVYFGRYAGDAGAIDILSLMGEYWTARGIETPLSKVRRAHHYDSVDEAKQHLINVGEVIHRTGFPKEIIPFTIGVLGYGNVSEGAQQILDCLPTCRVSPGAVEELVTGGYSDSNKVYITVFREEHLVESKSGNPFDLNEYYQQPELYKSIFNRFLPYCTLLINAVYWDERYPRFVTWDGLQKLAETQSPMKLQGIADITCDTFGSIECNVRSTDTGMPAYQVNPVTREVLDGHTGKGIVVLAVDNLPCELPQDSSTFFSGQLAPFVPNILSSDYDSTLEASGLAPEVKKAVVVYRGELTRDYQYLKQYLDF